MTFKPLHGLALAGAVALTAVAATSVAQPAPNAARAPMSMERPDPAAMAAHHAQHLRDALQLRPDQEPALRSFQEAMTPPADMRDRMRDRMGGGREAMMSLTTPQRLDKMRERMVERQAQFDRRAAATKRFYAALSPAQQKAFDAMGPMRGGHRGMMRGRGMGPGGPGMGHGGPAGPSGTGDGHQGH